MLIDTSWLYRRTMVFAVVLTGLVALALLTWRAVDAAEVALLSAVWQTLIMAIGGSYIFGAIWDDRNRMIHGRADPRPSDGGGQTGGDPAGSGQ